MILTKEQLLKDYHLELTEFGDEFFETLKEKSQQTRTRITFNHIEIANQQDFIRNIRSWSKGTHFFNNEEGFQEIIDTQNDIYTYVLENLDQPVYNLVTDSYEATYFTVFDLVQVSKSIGNVKPLTRKQSLYRTHISPEMQNLAENGLRYFEEYSIDKDVSQIDNKSMALKYFPRGVRKSVIDEYSFDLRSTLDFTKLNHGDIIFCDMVKCTVFYKHTQALIDLKIYKDSVGLFINVKNKGRVRISLKDDFETNYSSSKTNNEKAKYFQEQGLISDKVDLTDSRILKQAITDKLDNLTNLQLLEINEYVSRFTS